MSVVPSQQCTVTLFTEHKVNDYRVCKNAFPYLSFFYVLCILVFIFLYFFMFSRTNYR